jgi:hypothetical protein
MTTTTIGTTRNIQINKVVAVLIWSAAVTTTYAFLLALGLPKDMAMGFAVAVQAAMTWIERRVWAGNFDLLAWITLGADTLINASGIWSSFKNIDKTPLWAMFKDLGAPVSLSMWAKFAIALLIGVILAYGPEAVWKDRS